MRSRAGGGGGFEVSYSEHTHNSTADINQLDNEDEQDIDKFINDIEFALQVLKEQRPHYKAEPRFLD